MAVRPSAAARTAGVVDTVARAMDVLANPALVGTSASEQVVEGLREVLRSTPAHAASRERRAAAAIRTACAYLGAEQPEDAHMALQCALDHVRTAGRPVTLPGGDVSREDAGTSGTRIYGGGRDPDE